MFRRLVAAPFTLVAARRLRASLRVGRPRAFRSSRSAAGGARPSAAPRAPRSASPPCGRFPCRAVPRSRPLPRCSPSLGLGRGGGSAGASPPLPSASVGAAGRGPPPTALRRPSWSAGSGIVAVIVCAASSRRSSFAPPAPSPKPSPAATGGGISSSDSLHRKFLALRSPRGRRPGYVCPWARLSARVPMAYAASRRRVSSCSHATRAGGAPAPLFRVRALVPSLVRFGRRWSFALGWGVRARVGIEPPRARGPEGGLYRCPLSSPTAEGAGTLRPRPPLLRVSCMPWVVCLLPPSACAPLPRGRGAGGLVFKGWVSSGDMQPPYAFTRGGRGGWQPPPRHNVRRKAVASRGLVGV